MAALSLTKFCLKCNVRAKFFDFFCIDLLDNPANFFICFFFVLTKGFFLPKQKRLLEEASFFVL